MASHTTITRLGVLFVSAITVGATAYMTLDVFMHPRDDIGPAPEPLWPVPQFAMLDQHGQTITADDLRGDVWAVGFFFTSCPLICPQMNSRFAEYQAKLQELGDEAEGVKLVSMSIDPATDRPDRLKEYAELYDAEPGRWLFLTHPDGDRDAVWQLVGVRGFRMTVTEGSGEPGADPIEHTPRFLLIDQQGMVRDSYDSRDDPDMTRLLHDMRAVLREGERDG